MTSPETREGMDWWLKWFIAEFGLDDAGQMWQESYRKVQGLGKDGATLGQWVGIVVDIARQRHPEASMKITHALAAFERRNYERPS